MELATCYLRTKEQKGDQNVYVPNKLAKSYIKGFDQIFHKKMTKREIIKALDLGDRGEGALLGDTHIVWLGEETMVTFMYTESEFITISYEPIDSEYAQMMLSAYLQK